MIRKCVYPADEILAQTKFIPKTGKMKYDKYEKRMVDIVSGEMVKVEFDGELINMASDRYKVFAHNKKCISCGLEGQFMAMEKGNTDISYHFNMYAIKDGKEILFTKDHIIPLSKGGKKSLTNLQTMCKICNEKKGSKI